MLASFSISPQELWSLIGSAQAPLIIDARRRDFYDAAAGLLPGIIRREPDQIDIWMQTLEPTRRIVIACKANHEMSQSVTAKLRARGFSASALEGGYAGWTDAGFPLVDKAALQRFTRKTPSQWVTRRRPKIDRVACPWLIRRFVDPEAEFLFVEPSEVKVVAEETGAIPFDIEGVELSHEGERCSFDTMLKVFGLESETTLARLALIVCGADTARPDLAPEAAGLHAIALGLSSLAGDDDHGLLQKGFSVYDALYAWIRFAADERHNWPAKAR